MVKVAVTHNGLFHADDVFASVVLLKIFPGLKIRRTRDEAKIAKADIAYDIGQVYDPAKLRFDHHQIGAPARENGITLSAFGLVWREFGTQFCGGDADTADRIDRKFVQVIDAGDNGVSIFANKIEGITPLMFDQIIETFEPTKFGKFEAPDKQFHKAVEWAGTFLERLVIKEKDNIKRVKYVDKLVADSVDERYVVLEKPVIFDQMGLRYPNLLYVVYPNESNGTWGVRALRHSADDFTARKPLPEEWAGLVGPKLAQVSGVADATFAHKMRFLAVATSREGAMELLKKALEN